jgi:membrane protein YdbS with pleckstrin-like domain
MGYLINTIGNTFDLHTMKKNIAAKFFTLLIISIGLTVLGYCLDSDPPVGRSTAIVEFMIMIVIIFLIVCIIYFGFTYTIKKLKQLFC